MMMAVCCVWTTGTLKVNRFIMSIISAKKSQTVFNVKGGERQFTSVCVGMYVFEWVCMLVLVCMCVCGGVDVSLQISLVMSALK